jgi:hypothetical protein
MPDGPTLGPDFDLELHDDPGSLFPFKGIPQH